MLTSHTSKAIFYGNGVTTQFPFTFKIWKVEQLVLEVVDTQGTHQPLSPWTVELSDSGGTLHYIHQGAPLPNGYTLAVLRNMPFTQEINLITGTRFDPAVIETQLDKATAERQQLREILERSVQVPPTANYTANDILREIYQAQSESLAHATAAAQSELQAQTSADTAASYVEQSHEEMEKAQNEADRAKAEADRAAAEAQVLVDGISMDKNAQHKLYVKTYALEDFTKAPTKEEQSYPASVGSVANVLSLPIGTQIAVRCGASYVPQGCLPEDGTEYNKAQFPDLWNNYLVTGLLHTCTYAEAEAQRATTGACNAFALDLVHETFTTPYTPDGFVTQQALNNDALGKAYEAGLPNISGDIEILGGGNSGFWGAVSGPFTTKGGASEFFQNSYTSASNLVTGFNFDASKVHSIYGNSDTIQPRAIALRHFVVVATGSIQQSHMDWSAWATGLAAKVNISQIGYTCIINGATTGALHEVQDGNLGNVGIVSKNSRYVLNNPFGNMTPVMCIPEIFTNSVWSKTGFIHSTGGQGVMANYVQGVGIVIQTGGHCVLAASTNAGSGHGNSGNLTSALCRIHVWKIRGN